MKKPLLIAALALTVAACKKDNEPTVENTYYFKVWNKTQDSISVGATIYTKSNPGSPIYNYDIAILPSGQKTDLVKIDTKTPIDIEDCMMSAYVFLSGGVDYSKLKMSPQYSFMGMDTIFVTVVDTTANNYPIYYCLHINEEKW